MDGPQPLRIAVPLHARSDRRGAERIPACMPVQVGASTGTTQDLSASGLSFVSGRSHAIGERVQVVVDYLLDGHNYPLACEVEVMRVQQGPEGWVIGARLVAQPDGAPATMGQEPAPGLEPDPPRP